MVAKIIFLSYNVLEMKKITKDSKRRRRRNHES